MLGVVAGLLALFGPLEIAAGVLLGGWLFVPGTLSLPGLPHLALLTRVPLYALALRAALEAWPGHGSSRHGSSGHGSSGQGSSGQGEPRQGSSRNGEPSSRRVRLVLRAHDLRPTAIHAALAVWLVVGFVDGVALAGQGVSFAGDMHAWLRLVDAAVLFVVVLALARRLGPWRVARLAAFLACCTLVVAFAERVTGSGWSHFLFEHLPAELGSPGAAKLATRAGAVRVQVAAQFALEYGWVLVMMLPLVVVVIARAAGWPARPATAAGANTDGMPAAAGSGGPGRWRRALWIAPPAVVVGVVLTASRSAEVAVVAALLGLGVLAGLARRTMLRTALAAAIAIGAVAIVAPGALIAPFVAAAHTNSISIRLARLPLVFLAAASRPFVGAGFRGLVSTVPGVDDAYALTYATLGVLGLLAWLGLLTTIAVSIWPAIRAERGAFHRLTGAACLVGVVAVAVASGAYDLVVTPQSTWALMVVGALGVAVAEAVRARSPSSAAAVVGYQPARRASCRRTLQLLSGAMAGGVAGGVILLAVPAHVAANYQVVTVDPVVAGRSPAPISRLDGEVLVHTACGVMESASASRPGTELWCKSVSSIDPLATPGLALMRVSGPNGASIRSVLDAGESSARSAGMMLSITVVSPPRDGRPAWAATAPLWMAVTGIGAAAFALALRRRRAMPESLGQGSGAAGASSAELAVK